MEHQEVGWEGRMCHVPRDNVRADCDVSRAYTCNATNTDGQLVTIISQQLSCTLHQHHTLDTGLGVSHDGYLKTVRCAMHGLPWLDMHWMLTMCECFVIPTHCHWSTFVDISSVGWRPEGTDWAAPPNCCWLYSPQGKCQLWQIKKCHVLQNFSALFLKYLDIVELIF